MQHGIQQLPGDERMPRRVQAVLESESPWIARVAGVMIGLTNAYLLAAIAAIVNLESRRARRLERLSSLALWRSRRP